VARKTDEYGNKEPNLLVGVTRVTVHTARDLKRAAKQKVQDKVEAAKAKKAKGK
jgi:hypothetical protein